ncbi:MAG: hypothetical protein SVZ03_10705 [Spirochaetota bacterium]|nr:hypothetical protein [Spirochaetota bacterium]
MELIGSHENETDQYGQNDIPRLALVSYIPFVGWIIPLYNNKRDTYNLKHAKQGFILAVCQISIILLLSIINLFTPSEWRYFRLILVILIYLMYAAYFIICLWGMIFALKGNNFNISIIKKLLQQLDL